MARSKPFFPPWGGALPLLAALLAPLALPSCMSAYRQSVGADDIQIFSRTYFTDLNTAWQSCLEALKDSALDVSNRDSGYIQTKWTDNTEQFSMRDSFTEGDIAANARYRFRINVSKSFYNGRPAVKVTVQKDQIVEYDVLEGWRYVQTDSIEENTLLYRIGRLIYMKMKIAKSEEEKVRQEEDNAKF